MHIFNCFEKKMEFKVIFSSGGKYNKNPDQKLADEDTYDCAKMVVDALSNKGHEVEILKVTPSKIKSVHKIKADAVFNLCEWSGKDYPLGVDVLKRLEKNKIPYTGADSKCYEWCCDKITMKAMFKSFNIPTPNWVGINPKDSQEEIIAKISNLKFPIISKPAYEHCAIGIDKKAVIHTKRGAEKKIHELVQKFKQPVLVEEFIKGREFTMTVLKNHHLHIFPPAEIIFNSRNKDKFLSFETQWIDERKTYGSKVLSNKKLSLELKRLARKIFTKMECKGYVRIDIRYRAGKIYVLEVNINPGLTPYESYGLTVSTEAAGWNFDKLVNEIAISAVSNKVRN